MKRALPTSPASSLSLQLSSVTMNELPSLSLDFLTRQWSRTKRSNTQNSWRSTDSPQAAADWGHLPVGAEARAPAQPCRSIQGGEACPHHAARTARAGGLAGGFLHSSGPLPEPTQTLKDTSLWPQVQFCGGPQRQQNNCLNSVKVATGHKHSHGTLQLLVPRSA